MHRLGHWYTWTTLERPHGLHFFLDLREAEQRDIAKDIIKLACKTSMGAKAQAKQQGSTQVGLVGIVPAFGVAYATARWYICALAKVL